MDYDFGNDYWNCPCHACGQLSETPRSICPGICEKIINSFLKNPLDIFHFI